MTFRSIVATAGVLVGAAAAVAAGPPQEAVELKPGDMAPAFALQGSDGKMHRLADYKGRAVVIAWFPMAFTGG